MHLFSPDWCSSHSSRHNITSLKGFPGGTYICLQNKRSPYRTKGAHGQASTSRHTCSVLSNSLRPHGLYSPRNSPGQNTGVDSLSLLQGIFPTQGSNPGLSHCRLILYHLSHKRSPINDLSCYTVIIYKTWGEREREHEEREPDHHHLGLFALFLLTKNYLDHSFYLVNLAYTVAFS